MSTEKTQHHEKSEKQPPPATAEASPPAAAPEVLPAAPAPLALREVDQALAAVPRFERSLEPTNLREAQAMASDFAKSGLWQIKDEFDAFARIIAGRELGMNAASSLRNLFSFDSSKGRVMGEYSESQEARVFRTGEVEAWDWLKRDDDGASLKVKRRGRKEEIVSFTKADAIRAGLIVDGKPEETKDNWRMYPRRMFVARCRSEAISLLFPDVSRGIPSREDLMDNMGPGGAPPPAIDSSPRGQLSVGMQEKADLLKQMIASVTDDEGRRKALAAIKDATNAGDLSGIFESEVVEEYNALTRRLKATKTPSAAASQQPKA